MMLGAPGSSLMRAGGPYRARPAGFRKPFVDIDAEFCQREAGVLAHGHPRRASVVLLAGECDSVLPDTDDGGDDADIERAALEGLALFDMCLEISDVAPAFGGSAWAAGEADFAQRLAHGAIAVAVARGVDVSLGESADIGAAAEEIAEMAFLVAPGCDLDGALDIRVGIDDAGGFKRIDDTQRTIEPARVILAFEMRARQQFRARFRAGAQHIADAIDLGRQSRLGEPLHQPFQRAHMRLREGRLVNAGLVGADATQRIEVGEDAGAVEGQGLVGHCWCLSLIGSQGPVGLR